MGELATHGPGAASRPRWLFLFRPGWLTWHAFAIGATIGLTWLADWQLHRALSGNGLSWAYTFEWPLFTIFGWYFWWRTVRDELRRRASGATSVPDGGEAAASAAPQPAGARSEAYVAQLMAEVRATHGKRNGQR